MKRLLCLLMITFILTSHEHIPHLPHHEETVQIALEGDNV